MYCMFFFFNQKTAYELRISYCSSDVFSSDLLAAFDEPADRVRSPLEVIGMEVLGSVEAEVDHGFVSALAGGVVVDLHLARRLAEKLEVDLVMRVAVEAGARVGEEAGDDAGRGEGLQA